MCKNEEKDISSNGVVAPKDAVRKRANRAVRCVISIISAKEVLFSARCVCNCLLAVTGKLGGNPGAKFTTN